MEKDENLTVNEQQEPKKIEVITGDGELDISPVYEHLEVEKPKPKENRTIFVPEVKETPRKNEESEEENKEA
ncbi:MAG: hypothetical protein HFJ28_03230 [Clostridia bacterium]|nr:hypothetical protein [Clostridia bacterium]